MCWEIDDKLFAEQQKKAQEARIKQEQRADVIDIFGRHRSQTRVDRYVKAARTAEYDVLAVFDKTKPVVDGSAKLGGREQQAATAHLFEAPHDYPSDGCAEAAAA